MSSVSATSSVGSLSPPPPSVSSNSVNLETASVVSQHSDPTVVEMDVDVAENSSSVSTVEEAVQRLRAEVSKLAIRIGTAGNASREEIDPLVARLAEKKADLQRLLEVVSMVSPPHYGRSSMHIITLLCPNGHTTKA